MPYVFAARLEAPLDVLADALTAAAHPASLESRTGIAGDATTTALEAAERAARAVSVLVPECGGGAEASEAVAELLSSADAVFCTCCVAGGFAVKNMAAVDVLIVDEAAQVSCTTVA